MDNLGEKIPLISFSQENLAKFSWEKLTSGDFATRQKGLWVAYYLINGAAILCGIFDSEPSHCDLRSFGQYTTRLETAGFFVRMISDHNDTGTN